MLNSFEELCIMWKSAVNSFTRVLNSRGETYFFAHIWIYIYNIIYIGGYHSITDVSTTSLLLTKPSLDDDSGFRHGFGAELSLPLAQMTPAVSHDTTRVCQIVVTLWDCHIHANTVRALSWIFSIYFLLSDRGSPRLV